MARTGTGTRDADPDLYWLEKPWCLVWDLELLENRDPRSPAVRARWMRLHLVLQSIGDAGKRRGKVKGGNPT